MKEVNDFQPLLIFAKRSILFDRVPDSLMIIQFCEQLQIQLLLNRSIRRVYQRTSIIKKHFYQCHIIYLIVDDNLWCYFNLFSYFCGIISIIVFVIFTSVIYLKQLTICCFVFVSVFIITFMNVQVTSCQFKWIFFI